MLFQGYFNNTIKNNLNDFYIKLLQNMRKNGIGFNINGVIDNNTSTDWKWIQPPIYSKNKIYNSLSYNEFTKEKDQIYSWENPQKDSEFILSQFEVTNRLKDNYKFPIIYQYDDKVKFVTSPIKTLLLSSTQEYLDTLNSNEQNEIQYQINNGFSYDLIDVYYYYTDRWIVDNLNFELNKYQVDDNLPPFTLDFIVKTEEYETVTLNIEGTDIDFKKPIFKMYRIDVNKIEQLPFNEYGLQVSTDNEYDLFDQIQLGKELKQLDYIQEYQIDYIFQYQDVNDKGETFIDDQDKNTKLSTLTLNTISNENDYDILLKFDTDTLYEHGIQLQDLPQGIHFSTIRNRKVIDKYIDYSRQYKTLS